MRVYFVILWLTFVKCGLSFSLRPCQTQTRNLKHLGKIRNLKFVFSTEIKSINNVIGDSPRDNLLNVINNLKVWSSDFPGKFLSIIKKEDINILVGHVKEGVVAGFRSLLSSFQEGERGYRGEDLVFFEFVVGSLVLFGLPNIIKSAITITSAFLYSLGLSILLSSMWQMRYRLSLFLTPSSAGRTKTIHDKLVSHDVIQSGPYAFIRHPMYYGISLMCLGSSLISRDVHKFLASIILVFLFDKSASQEEIHLRRLFPNVYSEYAKNKYKLFAPFY